ncbi:MBL fold metallo-hydrolase [Imperialibacter roseus]|uniref:MBL fold metallo-hydrolase n=1 Tax=Imperialibacter roseus TaxID=1324217 RepID=A0ABZ0IJN7_9BACT|nr:MBL fold metallo-hydrolase [Imperialibacter roseus]WOK04379.1 MBL fold metallo-hydrolase [Imperialibacter roseus]
MIRSDTFNVAFLLLISTAISSCKEKSAGQAEASLPDQFIMVLGVAQDAGYPQAGCEKACCQHYWSGEHKEERVVSLGIVDKKAGKVWMIEATPDFKSQWHDLNEKAGLNNTSPDGIFLTHAHVGHYTGLMELGREIMGAASVPVYGMPVMRSFLTQNGPWSQLVALENISLQKLAADSTIQLSPDISITPFLVPHRDEFSETVGYRIESGRKGVIFIPDIDKWSKWDRNIRELVASADVAFLDATFFRKGEIARDMSEVPHPFVEESMALFEDLPESDRRKVHFIHFNHTNPLIWSDEEMKNVKTNGFNISREGDIFELVN